MAYIFPKNLVAGFNQREHGLLAFISYVEPKKKTLKSETAWNHWKDDNIPIQSWVNEPTSGFVINKHIKRDGYYTTSEFVRIWHPLGFEFEISGGNFEYLMSFVDTSRGEILTPCVLGWDGKKLQLVSTYDVAFNGITDNPMLGDSAVFCNLEYGRVYALNGERYVYMGHGVMDYSQKEYFFSALGKEDKYPYFFDITNNCVTQLKTRAKKLSISEDLTDVEKNIFDSFALEHFNATERDNKYQFLNIGMHSNPQKFCASTIYDCVRTKKYKNNYTYEKDDIFTQFQENTWVLLCNQPVNKYSVPTQYEICVYFNKKWYVLNEHRVTLVSAPPSGMIVADHHTF